MLTLYAPAKINIFLDIIKKLDDGYHSLFMVMQSIGLCDEVTLEKTESGIELLCDDEDVPRDSKNTAYKAAEIFFEKTGIKSGIKIQIKKNIPSQAGLGGASADAAAVIKGLNEIFDTGLSTTGMIEIGEKVGSDVPFCILGGTCLAQSRGAVLSQLKPLKHCHAVLVKPEKGVSTALAYAQADETYLYHPDCSNMLDCCERGDFKGICRYAGNVFEQIIEVPERVDIKRIMRANHSLIAQMSGSGPTVFGLFESREDAENTVKQLGEKYGKVYLTETLEIE